MLILARKVGESIRIGNDIEVRIIGCSGLRTQLAIKAPAALKIWRVDEPKDAATFPREPRAGTRAEPVYVDSTRKG
jgi:carbon storage regulator CsrA